MCLSNQALSKCIHNYVTIIKFYPKACYNVQFRYSMQSYTRTKLVHTASELLFNSSLLAGGYWGFHRGKPVAFANRAPSWIFEARAPGQLPLAPLLRVAYYPKWRARKANGFSRRRKTPTPTGRLWFTCILWLFVSFLRIKGVISKLSVVNLLHFWQKKVLIMTSTFACTTKLVIEHWDDLNWIGEGMANWS